MGSIRPGWRGSSSLPPAFEPPWLTRGDETASSVRLPGRGEIEILQRHLFEEPLVLLLRQRPQDRGRLVAGVPVLAAADPDGPGKSGAEAGEEFLGRGDGRGGRGAAGAPFGNEPHDAADLLLEAQRHRHVVDRAERSIEREQVRETG